MNLKQLSIWFGLLSLYLATRLINLKIIPIFTDEAIYSFWAQVALHDPANRFISLEDGKQPLFIWLAAISQKFIGDPLIATRLVSIVAGFFSMIGIFLLTKTIFANHRQKSQIATLASFLYIILPFTLLYDRMALFDSLLTAFGIWATLFAVRLAQIPKLDTAILTGLFVGLALITKSVGIFFLYLFPFSLLFFNFKTKDLALRFTKWLGYTLVVVLISEVILNSLRLSPLFYIISRKNLEFIRSFPEFLASPFLFAKSNLFALTGWIIAYIGLPLFILFLIGLLWGFYLAKKQTLYLSILILAPFATEVFFNKVLYPRFILFYFPYIIIIISFIIILILQKIPRFKIYFLIVVTIAILIPAASSFRLLTNPTRAEIADTDKWQYLNAWPAGYGVDQVVAFLREQAKKQDIYVATEGTFGLFPYALNIYFFGQNNVHILSFWPVNQDNLPTQVLDIAESSKTYFIFNENQKEITNSRLRLIGRYQKGIGKSYMRLFEVLPQ